MIYSYIILMALTTYLIRMLPLVLVRGKIKSRFAKSFLYYVPYACLTAMTIPSIFSSTSSIVSASAGFGVAVILGFNKRSLPVVAAAACVTVFVVERLMGL
jgi:branched-subunit amino acid transport protein